MKKIILIPFPSATWEREKGLVDEHEAMAVVSAQGLARAYGDQEPEYSPASIKKSNPDFRP